MTEPKLIPLEVLFGNPTRVSPRISPDGSRLAWIAPDEGVLNVWVRTVGSDDDRPVTSDRDRGIRQFFWGQDGNRILYVQDTGGDENWRLYDTHLESGTTRDLTPFDGVRAEVIQHDKRHPTEVLVGLNKDNPQLHDVWKLDLTSGDLVKIVDNPGFVGWVADADHQVRAGIAPTPDGGMAILARADVDGEFAPLLVAGHADALSTQPLEFSEDGSRLLCISSLDANAARLLWIDVASGEQTVVAADESYDVSAVRLHPDTREVQAVGFLRDRLEWDVVDDAIAGDWEALGRLDDGDMVLQGGSRDDRTWLVAYNHDDGPVRYYAWDRDAQEATFLFVHRPELEDYDLAPMQPFSFTARDGLTIHGYVTFPVGVEPVGLPAVLNVHGGPWARDTWGMNPEAQWMANRGYACIQVNFRGSLGYGKDFTNAGDRQWAAAMHDDLLDAVDHCVEQGWIDRERVAIYGGSYGGYAALVGATFTPDVFACAVDIVGPSSLETLIRSVPDYWVPMLAQFHNRVGNPDTESEFLWSRSPLSRVDDIKIPLLIAQGANDPRVKQAESEQIVAALKDKDIEHTYLLYPDEGHGFAKPENRLAFYREAEGFLAAQLGGRSEG